MYTGKFIGRMLLILVVIMGTILLVSGVTALLWAEYESFLAMRVWEN